MKFQDTILLLLLLACRNDAFTLQRKTKVAVVTCGMSSDENKVDLGLTPELKRVTDAFSAIGDEQVRYKQLLYMAQNTQEANNMPESSKIAENK